MCVSQGITELNGDHCQKINKTFIGINYVIRLFFSFGFKGSFRAETFRLNCRLCVPALFGRGPCIHVAALKCFPVSFSQRLPVPDVTSHGLILHAALFCLFVPI